jgi:hypothetical protein
VLLLLLATGGVAALPLAALVMVVHSQRGWGGRDGR